MTDVKGLVRPLRDLDPVNEPETTKQLGREAATALEQLQAENERLREGLEFYANPQIYEPHPHGPAFDRRDVSFKAKSLLQPKGEQQS